MIDGIAGLINRKRRQILVHSFIYYQLNENLISDYTFDAWALELVQLQKDYPEIADKCIYPKEFKEWDGAGGMGLPYTYPNVQDTAYQLLRYDKKLRGLKIG